MPKPPRRTMRSLTTRCWTTSACCADDYLGDTVNASAVAPARPRTPTVGPTSLALEASHLLIPVCYPADWRKVRPLEYLAPFLEVVRSPETSGPITAVALTSVRRMLEENILGGRPPMTLANLRIKAPQRATLAADLPRMPSIRPLPWTPACLGAFAYGPQAAFTCLARRDTQRDLAEESKPRERHRAPLSGCGVVSCNYNKSIWQMACKTEPLFKAHLLSERLAKGIAAACRWPESAGCLVA